MGGRKRFPLLIEDFDNITQNFNFVASRDEFVRVNNEACKFLKDNNSDFMIIKKTNLLLEEIGLKILDFNQDLKKKVLVEVSVQINPKKNNRAYLVVRDNGKFLDLTNEDNEVTSLNSFMLSSYLSTVQDKSYVKTIGFNRSHYEI